MTAAPDRILVTVPWPVRLFGDLQDDLGLPALAVATDLRTAVGATPTTEKTYGVDIPWVDGVARLDPDAPDKCPDALSPIAHVLATLRDRGMPVDGGFDFKLYSRVPKEEALAESPVLTVIWTVAALAAHKQIETLSGGEVAAIACTALEKSSARSSGNVEIQTCVMGGALMTRPDLDAKPLAVERTIPGLILAFPAEPISPASRAGEAIRKTREATSRLEELMPDFNVAQSHMSNVMAHLNTLSPEHAGIIYGHLTMRELCTQSCALLEEETGFDDDAFGELMDDAHNVLCDYFGLRIPAIEALADEAKAAGALGCKIDPAMGGLIVFAPDDADTVVAAIKKTGASAHIAATSDGMHLEHVANKT